MSNNVACATPPAASGALLLPAIDGAVPALLSKDSHCFQILARFAQAAKKVGVPLPEGDFVTIDQVVAAQWTQFIQANYPHGRFDGLAGKPVVTITDDTLEAVIAPERHLNTFQLRTVLEPLEAAAAGLGWFVEKTISQATCHGHQIYDMGMASYMLDVFHHDLDEFTDRGYARSLLAHTSNVIPPLSAITETMIDELKGDYSFWPSDLNDQVGGHTHLLGMHLVPAPSRPSVMKARQVEQWLKSNERHRLAAVVDVALRFQKALKKDVQREFLWNGSEDDSEGMGATCFVCWDDPSLLFEAVQHYEEHQFQGGGIVDAFARRVLPLDEATDSNLKGLARALKNYINRSALLAELLSHFPIWDEDDET